MTSAGVGGRALRDAKQELAVYEGVDDQDALLPSPRPSARAHRRARRGHSSSPSRPAPPSC
jgi:hypothetical protein